VVKLKDSLVSIGIIHYTGLPSKYAIDVHNKKGVGAQPPGSVKYKISIPKQVLSPLGKKNN